MTPVGSPGLLEGSGAEGASAQTWVLHFTVEVKKLLSDRLNAG